MPPLLTKQFSWPELYEKAKQRIPNKTKDPNFKHWFMNNEKTGLLFDFRLIGRCFAAHKDMVSKDKDHFVLIVGKEGYGKSTLGMQIMGCINPNATVDDICFTGKEYIHRLRIAKPGSCLLIDEGGVNLFSREFMTSNNISMIKIFMLQRQKNISVVVCCPSFWDVDQYIRNHRINTLIRIMDQGKYMGYLPRSIKILNEVGYNKKKISNIKLPNGHFWHGHFNKNLPSNINREAYLKKKEANLERFLEKIDKNIETVKFRPAYKVAKQLGLTTQQMDKRLAEGTIKGKKIGATWFIPTDEYDKLMAM